MTEYKDVYTDPSSKGAFGGVSKLAKAIEGGTIKAAQEYLKSNTAYTLTKQRRFKFRRSKTYVHSPLELFQVDLTDLSIYAKENDGIRFLLFVIDCFSRKLQIVPLRNKSGASLHAAFVSLFADENNRPLKVQADRGTEFYNKEVKKLFNQLKIKLYSSFNDDIKAALVERVQRTIKGMLMRLLIQTHSKRYIDSLEGLVQSYNNTVHSSTGLPPNLVTDENSELVRQRLYPMNNNSPREKKPKYKVDDYVRISLPKQSVGHKGYDQQFTDEVFQVAHVIKSDPVRYRLKDNKHEVLEGSFYTEEIEVINKPLKFRVEAILQTRQKRKGVKEYLVRWKGYSLDHDSWITEDQLTI